MTKYDSVVEAVRYTPEGKIQMVRAYVRRGPTWSDRVLLSRDELVKMLRDGLKVVAGQRIPLLAGTFETGAEIQINGDTGKERLYTKAANSSGDALEGVPLF